MILSYENVLPADYFFGGPTLFHRPTAEMKRVEGLYTSDLTVRTYKQMQEFVCLMADYMREARHDHRFDDSWLVPPFLLRFADEVTHESIVSGRLYPCQLDVKSVDHTVFRNMDYLLRRIVVDYNYIWRYYQCLGDHDSFTSLLGHAVGVASSMFRLDLAEHNEPAWCSVYTDTDTDDDDELDNSSCSSSMI
ncbi:ORF60 [Betabaculovirus altermyunipunctae]|uniref:ORF60 n=1 Tax=Betabaculovirus altermyunipunctae TaxID=3051996 RepID=A0A1S5YED2_9BBAC|nr:ORF60 [Betabaculovirus altermyunipunctae]AQQ80327.1 ORF60 [Betabaculovirus altermyunipunctae]